ncbi:MAG: hypothetical protein QOJ84_1524 [Bradyrhizobium sp.]|nr:hypothetical protein [Bradyrhizobium sp.]
MKDRLPKLSLPVRLVLLVAGTTLPLIIFAGAIIFSHYQRDRDDASRRVLATVRGIRLVLDSEMQRMTGGLQMLSLTNALRDGDFEGFRRITKGFLDQYRDGGVLLVADRDGRQVFSSVTPDTASLPPRNNRDIVEKVFTEKKPLYSNLFVGAVKKKLIVTVEVPVFRDNEVIYDLSFSPPIEMFQDIIDTQRPSDDWTMSIFDAQGTNFARVPNPEETIGKRASPTLYAAMFQKSEATLQTVSLEGVPLITAFMRSSLTGWDVAARVLQPYALSNPGRIRMSGPKVPLSPRQAVVMSMILHEIATNAAKYGALSNESGTVTLDWSIVADNPVRRLKLSWTETDGPHVAAPVQRGFGSRLIERSARDQLGGDATVDFLPRGVVYTLNCSLDPASAPDSGDISSPTVGPIAAG